MIHLLLPVLSLFSASMRSHLQNQRLLYLEELIILLLEATERQI